MSVGHREKWNEYETFVSFVYIIVASKVMFAHSHIQQSHTISRILLFCRDTYKDINL